MSKENTDVNKFISHLNSKWKNQTCPMCHENKWSVSDTAYELREYNDGNLVVGGPLMPIMPVTCTHCGYTIFVNALIGGAICPPARKEGEDGK